MDLATFFGAINAAGVRLALAGGDLQLRGPAGSITPALAAAAAVHKQALVVLLANSPPGVTPATIQAAAPVPGRTDVTPAELARAAAPDEDTDAAEREAIELEGCGLVGPAELARHAAEWDAVAAAG